MAELTNNNKALQQSRLTTIDNPFDPFEEFDDWLQFDEDSGYHTNAYLARIALTSDKLSRADQQLMIDRAIDEIVDMNVLGVYKKVTKVLE